ncbi:hypothetical protein QYE76_036807 [Lolium multiflorum]|uniref:Ribonuclease H1 N-terminal domain-containing protein n=1 Tax=Lolium multiflorum TaxID=4521 RepID=A0AAD8R492_LOLMU|nr:hypothetical protein QYE76_036807 [Lolium multiflorum]
MHTIISFGLATGKYAMGSSEPPGSAAATPSPEDAEIQESDTIILDGPPEKAANTPDKATIGKRKRGAFADEELVAFTNMIVDVKDAAQAIRDNKPTDMHPDLYNAVMDMLGFAEEDLMAALSHLIDHKAQGCSFVGMIEPHCVLWLRNTLPSTTASCSGALEGGGLGDACMEWYVVSRGRVKGIYNSWRIYQYQVSAYSNNNYRGYETLEEAQQEYLTFLEDEFMVDQAIDQPVPLAHLPSEEVHALQGAPPEVHQSRVKDYIIVFLIVVIVRILFF